MALQLWKTELERVGPRLKGLRLGSGKEWRSHLEATRKHQSTIEAILPSTSKQLDSIGASTGEMLERVVQREKYINNQVSYTHFVLLVAVDGFSRMY